MKAKLVGPKVELIFRALSDRTRLRILNLLQGGELCVCDLVDVLDSPQPTISRHLAYLRKAGLVVARKDGLWSYYRLTDARTEFHERLLECLMACREEVPQLNRDLRVLRSSERPNCCE